MKFHLKSPLFEEQADANAGGGDGNAAPPIDLTKFRTELKTELLGEIRKDLNGIEKKNENFRKQFTTGFDSFKTDLTAMLKPKESDQPNPDDDEDDDDAKATAAAQAAASAAGGAPPKGQQQDPPRQPKKHQPSPSELKLQRELETLRNEQKELRESAKKAREEAEAKERESTLRTEISKRQFNSDRGPSDMFALLKNNIVRGDDGILYGPEGKTVDEYVQDEYAARPYLHPAKQVNGSGAGPATGNPAIASKNFDTDNIRPGMSAEEIATAMQSISQHIARR